MASWKKVLVSGSSIDVAGITLGGTAISSTAAELNLLDGVSGLVQADFTKLAAVDATAAELNIMDGGTSATSTTIVNADRVVVNDNGTMKQVAVTDLDTYFSATTKTLTNKTINADQLSGTVANARLDAQLQDVAGLAVTDGGVIIGDGSNFVLETGATLRTSLGLGTGNDVQHAEITGSDALFSGTVTANAFAGDGSGLTGVSAGSLDIDNFTELDATPHATQDEFLISDNGTEKRVSMTNVANGAFALVSGDATIAAGGALTIGNDKVTNAKLANIAQGSVKVGGSSNAPTDLDASGDGKILVGDGTDVNSVSVSGDITLANNGAVAIASGVVVNADINSSAAIAYSKLAALSSGNILVGNGSNVATSVAMSGDVGIANNGATTIADGAVDTAQLAADAVTAAKIEDDAISGEHLDVTAITDQTDLGNAFADADTLLVYDASGTALAEGTVKNLANYMQNELTFTSNTDVDVSVSNLKTRLASNLGDVTIGDANDNVTILGNLTVSGTKTELQTANLNVEDQFILLDSGSGGGTDTGIIFGGSADTANSGYALGWDDSAGVFGISAEIASDATSLGTLSGKLGYIETSTAVPSSAPTRQGVGSIHVKTDDETIWIYS